MLKCIIKLDEKVAQFLCFPLFLSQSCWRLSEFRSSYLATNWHMSWPDNKRRGWRGKGASSPGPGTIYRIRNME